MNKYGAIRTRSELCQRTFASKAEARRGDSLRTQELAGEIKDLEYQPRFVLCKKPRITITLDFAYTKNGERVIEEVKGYMTRDSRTKLAWLREQQGIEVRIIK